MTIQNPPADDGLDTLIGREEVFTAPDEIGHAFIRLFAMATEDWNPVYHNQGVAAQTTHGGIIAPPTLIGETGHFHQGPVSEGGGFPDRLPLPPILAGGVRVGNEYEFHQPVKPSDIVTARIRLVEIRREQGRSGPLAFVVSLFTYTNQHNELLATNYETMLHRIVSAEQGGGHAAP